jgi:hypothetical protein
MSTTAAGSFEPKKPVELAPPKDDPIAQDYLAKCDGMCVTAPTKEIPKRCCTLFPHSRQSNTAGKYRTEKKRIEG